MIKNIMLEDLNKQDENGQTLLMKACKELEYDTIQKLISVDVDVNLKDVDGNTALIIFLKNFKDENIKYFEIIKKLTDELDVNLDHKNNEGETVLIIAAYKQLKDIVKYFISKECDINMRDKSGNSAVMKAYHGSYKTDNITFDILVNAGADLNLQDSNGNTLLIEYFRDLVTVKLLLDLRVDTTIKNNEGKTAYEMILTNSKVSERKEIIELLKPNENTIILEKIRSNLQEIERLCKKLN